MHWLRASLLLIFSSPVWAAEGYIIGIGAEVDNADASAGSLSGELAVTENTWVSGAIARNSVDLPRGITLDTVYADFGIDHWFDPVGVRATAAYWGDSDILDSVDYRGSLYWRNDNVSLSGELERRDFSFDVFRDDLRPGQDAKFSANGVGLSVRIHINESVDLSLSGMGYDYDVNLGIDANRPILDFLSISRLSLINGLIDYRARIGIGIDAGDQRWSLDLGTSKGEVDGRETHSATLRFLTPMGTKSDIELGLGVDKSPGYDTVTLFSVFLYFYG